MSSWWLFILERAVPANLIARRKKSSRPCDKDFSRTIGHSNCYATSRPSATPAVVAFSYLARTCYRRAFPPAGGRGPQRRSVFKEINLSRSSEPSVSRLRNANTAVHRLAVPNHRTAGASTLSQQSETCSPAETGHGRPWLASVSHGQAKFAVETMGAISEYLWARHGSCR